MVTCLFQDVSVVVSAESKKWTSDSDKSIYKSDGEEKKKYENISEDSEQVEDVGSTIGSLLADLLNSISDFIDEFFGMIGLSLENIVYGRVGGAGVKANINGETYRISLFTYETAKGNPYGIVSFAIYAALRRISYLIVPLFVGLRTAFAVWSTNTMQAKKTAVEMLKNSAIFFILLVTMPWILDMMLYIRDVVLFAVSKIGIDLLGLDGTVNIATAFDAMAKKEGTFMLSLLRLASKFLTLYFGFLYVGVALSVVVDVIAFPFVCISMILTPQILSQWFKNVMANLLVPVIDSILFLIPLMFSMFGNSLAIGIFQLIVMCMLIPARGEFRRILGLNPNLGMEMAALGGFGASLGLAKSAIQGTGKLVSGLNGARETKKTADMYSDMAKEDERVAEQAVQSSGGGSAPEEYQTTSSSEATDGAGSGGTGSSGADAGGAGAGDGSGGDNAGGAGGGGASNPDGDTEPEVPQESVTAAASQDTSSAGDNSVNGADVTDGQRVPTPNYSNVYRKYANSGNVTNGQFSSLSNADKAKLYKRRAVVQGLAAGAGVAGGFMGAALGTAAYVGGNGGMGMNAHFTNSFANAGADMVEGVVGSFRSGLGNAPVPPASIRSVSDRVQPSSQTRVSGGQPSRLGEGAQKPEQLGAQPVYPMEDTIAPIAEEMGVCNESYLQQASYQISDFQNNPEFNTAFAEAAMEFPNVVGTQREGRVDEDGNAVTWKNTPQDRYEYFREQKAEPLMAQQYHNALHSDHVAPVRSATIDQNELARSVLEQGYRTSIRDSSYPPLEQGNLKLAGYDFSNGFQYTPPKKGDN